MDAQTSLRAIGTTAVLHVTDEAALPAARRVLVTSLRALDLACSRFRDDSELTALNRSAGRPVLVGTLLWDSLQVALETAAATDGLVDPTVGRALRLSGYDRTFLRIGLRGGRLVAAPPAPAGRFAEVELDERRRTALVPADVELDLGATAKALAADRIAADVFATTGSGCLVALGGDVAVAGDAPPGGWPVRIADDHRAGLDAPGPTIGLRFGGVATSSTTVRRWRTAEGERHHIVDPATGRPTAGPWRTATVAAGSCVAANAATTASLVLGVSARAWLESRGLAARLVDARGHAIHTTAWPVELAQAA